MSRLDLGRGSLLAGLVVGFLVLSAAAPDTRRASVAIEGGPLVVTPAPLRFTAMDTPGLDQTWTSSPGDNTWTVVDARGTGLGWHLTVLATDSAPPDSPRSTSEIAPQNRVLRIQLRAAQIAVIAGNAAPRSTVSALTAIPPMLARPLTIISAAANTGMGSYALHPNFALAVPAGTPVGPGTAAQTITVTAVSGP